MGDWHPQREDTDQKPAGMLDQEYYLEKARKSFSVDCYEQALSYYSRTLQYDINIEEAWLGQLRCLIELNELPEAITWSNRALERFPKSAGILSARAVAEERLGRGSSAIGFSDAAFASHGVDAYAWIARGDVLVSTNLVSAKACFEKAIEMSSRDPLIRIWIARAYLIRKQHHLALSNLNQAVRLDPEHFTCWYWIGKCSDALGQTSDARVAYRRALAINPSFLMAQNALQEVENRGLMSKLVTAIRRVILRQKNQ